jgi:hypothetical protein
MISKTKMGVSASLNFTNDTDACSIGDAVVSVNGLPAGSASPSGQWILTLKNAFYGNRPIPKAFMKWFVNPNEARDRLNTMGIKEDYTNQYVDELGGLLYEIKVYRDIVSPLIVNHICPNFVKFLASGNTCNQENIFQILYDKTSEPHKYKWFGSRTQPLIHKQSPKDNFYRNMTYVFTSADGRPSINDDSVTGNDLEKVVKKTEFRDADISEIIKTDSFEFLITEAITNDDEIKTITLGEYLQDYDIVIVCKIFFQIIYACYAMQLSGMNHIDLHSGNVYIEISKEEKEVIYVTDFQTYRFMTKHKVLIYDFDFSYVERLGYNPKMLGGGFTHANMTNDNIPKRDIAKSAFYIYDAINKVNSHDAIEFISIIAADRQGMNGILDVYSRGPFLQTRHRYSARAANNWGDWAGHETILSRIAEDIPDGKIIKENSWLLRETRSGVLAIDKTLIIKNPPKNKHERVFVCSKRLFTSTGEVNLEKTNELFNEIKSTYSSF